MRSRRACRIVSPGFVERGSEGQHDLFLNQFEYIQFRVARLWSEVGADLAAKLHHLLLGIHQKSAGSILVQ